jgi:membrane associated rhomboid family serine protease
LHPEVLARFIPCLFFGQNSLGSWIESNPELNFGFNLSMILRGCQNPGCKQRAVSGFTDTLGRDQKIWLELMSPVIKVKPSMSSNEMRGLVQEVKAQVVILACFVGLMWISEGVDSVLGGALNQFGIIPRNIVGLRGLLFAPFLHGDFPHLIANTIPFVTLGWLVMLRRISDFFAVTAIAMLIGGLGTWLIAPANTVHIGASGVIFGYLGFLISRGYFERRPASVLFSVVIGLAYGGLIWGVLPGQVGISWQGHLFGFIGGVVAAWLIADEKPQQKRSQRI